MTTLRQKNIIETTFYGAILFFVFINIMNMTSSPPVMFDESALCRITYFFQNNFQIRSDYIISQSSGAYWLPPIFYWVWGAWFKIVGFGIVEARALSVLIGVIFLCVYFKTLQLLKVSRFVFVLSIILFVIDPAFLHAGKLARPDILSSLFLLLSVAFLIRHNDSRSNKHLISSGCFFAASVFTHPLSALVLPAFIFELLKQRLSLSRYIKFFVPIILSGVLWLLWIIPHWNDAYPQIIRNIAFRRGDSWWQPFVSFFEVYKFAPISLIVYSVAVIIALYQLVKNRFTVNFITALSLTFIFFLRVFTSAETMIYISAFMPIIFTSSIEKFIPDKKKLYLLAISIILICFCTTAINTSTDLSHSFPKNSHNDYYLFTKEVSKKLKRDAHVLVYGYPDIAMALWKIRPDLHLTTFYWFGNQQALAHLRSVDYIVHARTGTVQQGQELFNKFWNSISDRITMSGRKLSPPDIIGNEDVDWTYSARIYKFISDSGEIKY